MVVQCDQCSSKFRLDDSKIKEGGAKVRCSKCKHIFFVQKEVTADETDLDSLLNGLVPPPPLGGAPEGTAEAANVAEIKLPGTEEQKGADLPPEEFDFGEFNFDSEPVSDPSASSFAVEEKDPFDFGEVNIEGAAPIGGEPGASEKETSTFDHDAFSFSEEPSAGEPSEEPMPSVPEVEISIDGLDDLGIAETPLVATTPASTEHGDVSYASPSPAPFSFEQDAEPVIAPSVPTPEEENNQPAPFDFGDFEFGEAPPAEKSDEKSAHPAGPEMWEWDKQESPSLNEQEIPYTLPETFVSADEPPPLSIASRRRGASSLPIAVTAICVLLVTALAGGGFYLFKEGPSAFNKVGLGFMAKWFGLESKEEGGIAIKSPVAYFLRNDEAGEIFVINGEAVNNFAKPRASVQVKVVLYGRKGEPLLQKTAYCGNALSRDQLTTLPVAKLEAAMGNQFGDSLSNLAVPQGKSIPFVLAFTNVPKEAVDFGVEVVGSTAAGK